MPDGLKNNRVLAHDIGALIAAAKYRGNLARLHQWFAEGKARRKWRVAGRLSGTAELS